MRALKKYFFRLDVFFDFVKIGFMKGYLLNVSLLISGS
jgi:hypothetical protein